MIKVLILLILSMAQVAFCMEQNPNAAAAVGQKRKNSVLDDKIDDARRAERQASESHTSSDTESDEGTAERKPKMQKTDQLPDQPIVAATASKIGKYLCDVRFIDGSVCGKRCFTEADLRSHIKRTEHVTKDFQCPSCPSHFRGRQWGGIDEFLRHIEKCGEKAQQHFKNFQSIEPRTIEICKNCNKYYFMNKGNHAQNCRSGLSAPQAVMMQQVVARAEPLVAQPLLMGPHRAESLASSSAESPMQYQVAHSAAAAASASSAANYVNFHAAAASRTERPAYNANAAMLQWKNYIVTQQQQLVNSLIDAIVSCDLDIIQMLRPYIINANYKSSKYGLTYLEAAKQSEFYEIFKPYFEQDNQQAGRPATSGPGQAAAAHQGGVPQSAYSKPKCQAWIQYFDAQQQYLIDGFVDAICNADLATVQLIRPYITNINRRSSKYWTVLEAAKNSGNDIFIPYLVKEGAK